MSEGQAWAIFFLPLASFLVIGLFIRPFLNGHSRLAGYVTIAAVGGAFALSLMALRATTGHHGPIGWDPHPWLTVGDLEVRLGILMDPLTAIMAVVVSGVSLAVQVYSQGYMRGDPGYARYYALMSLFTAAMLGLVLASSIVQLFVFWELVGLSSYLLIGFWYHRPAAARAAVKAFVVTRLGDVGLLLAILYLFSQQGAFAAEGLNALEVPDLYRGVAAGLLGGTALTWLGIGIFAGAVGKSAQFPLHIWLPDAMEGPTPVSALIHAATMVAAGVFLVARFFPVFEAAPVAMDVVALIGGFTVVFAATMGMVMNDIKRVVAYSTISQLGYMMLALGVGAYGAAIFHLFNHAFFKALLFLGSGSVNHATGTFNMRYMGGLRGVQKWTYVTFLVAGLSLAGVFPLAGFWSKDEVLAEAFASGDVVSIAVFVLALLGVFMTAFYIFRALFMTFHGEFRGGADAEAADAPGAQNDAGSHGGVHLAESPWVMVAPMLGLAVLAVVSGFVANPPFALGPIPAHWFSHFLVAPGAEFHAPEFVTWLAVLSLALAGAGIAVAWALYGARSIAPERLTIRPLHRLIVSKYRMDDLYEGLVVGRLFYRVGCGVLDWFDRAVVDGTVDAIGSVGRNVGRAIGQVQSGQVQAYGTVFTVGFGVMMAVYLLWR